jgi:hypothetical protein
MGSYWNPTKNCFLTSYIPSFILHGAMVAAGFLWPLTIGTLRLWVTRSIIWFVHVLVLNIYIYIYIYIYHSTTFIISAWIKLLFFWMFWKIICYLCWSLNKIKSSIVRFWITNLSTTAAYSWGGNLDALDCFIILIKFNLVFFTTITCQNFQN